MIIDYSYFIREINIPQLSQPSVSEALDLFIEKYQAKFLKEVFGIELAKLIDVYLATPEGDPIEERIQSIVEGIEFVYEGNTEVWTGLRNESKISPVSNFVFYWYVTDGVTFLSQTGEAGMTSENSYKVSVNDRLVFVWNEMIELMKSLQKLLENGDYPEYKPLFKFEVQNRFNL